MTTVTLTDTRTNDTQTVDLRHHTATDTSEMTFVASHSHSLSDVQNLAPTILGEEQHSVEQDDSFDYRKDTQTQREERDHLAPPGELRLSALQLAAADGRLQP